ncbi:MAG TPA: carbonic anhydrase [Streptomyces sp.]|uniref:carbonic anhydrase n=1 Tax=Streptomyces sp. TaxID=1931 RepID=UPI002D53494D|nr:carbonic anhydrase [Streptomyces sp.]HZG04427.1 carbonic anhydrase [Streptomyces sp.]
MLTETTARTREEHVPRSPRNHRWTLRGAARGAAGLLGGVPRQAGAPPEGGGERLAPAEALRLLREGNRRAVRGGRSGRTTGAGRAAGAGRPLAAVLACVDCRVPPETLFDREPGSLLVIRTAAHTLDAMVEGSVEYGPVELDVPLVVVLGHERCETVAAAVTARATGVRPPAHLAVASARLAQACRVGARLPGDAVENTVRAQTDRVVARLREDPVLLPLLRQGALEVVGAHYRAGSGEVEFLTGPAPRLPGRSSPTPAAGPDRP